MNVITGFNITKIQLQSYNYGKVENVSINQELKLGKPPMVTTQSTPFGERNTLRTEFSLKINYISPSIGYIIFEGFVDCIHGDSDIIRSEWDNPNNQVVNKMKTECGNAIFQNVIPLALLLSNRVNLPPVIPLPKIEFRC
jgi:hypothetical protein